MSPCRQSRNVPITLGHARTVRADGNGKRIGFPGAFGVKRQPFGGLPLEAENHATSQWHMALVLASRFREPSETVRAGRENAVVRACSSSSKRPGAHAGGPRVTC